jgi:hypothetical protein
MTDPFVPHGSTCEADHDNGSEWGKCGELATERVDDSGRWRYVCKPHAVRWNRQPAPTDAHAALRARLRELAEKARPGPWELRNRVGEPSPSVLGPVKENGKRDRIVLTPLATEAGLAAANCAYIAAIDPQTLLSILAAWDAQTARADRLEQERDEARKTAEIRRRMIDIPTAWELTRATPKDQHHEQCSYRVAAMLCDCAAFRVMEHVSGLLRAAEARAEKAEREAERLNGVIANALL